MGTRGEVFQSEVLTVLRRQASPLSAYDLLSKLRASNPKIAPPTIYRALSALAERGQIHRLESLNAYIACRCEDHHHASILSICNDCGAVEENLAPDLLDKLALILGKSGFSPLRHVIEVHGICAACSAERAPA